MVDLAKFINIQNKAVKGFWLPIIYYTGIVVVFSKIVVALKCFDCGERYCDEPSRKLIDRNEAGACVQCKAILVKDGTNRTGRLCFSQRQVNSAFSGSREGCYEGIGQYPYFDRQPVLECFCNDRDACNNMFYKVPKSVECLSCQGLNCTVQNALKIGRDGENKRICVACTTTISPDKEGMKRSCVSSLMPDTKMGCNEQTIPASNDKNIKSNKQTYCVCDDRPYCNDQPIRQTTRANAINYSNSNRNPKLCFVVLVSVILTKYLFDNSV